MILLKTTEYTKKLICSLKTLPWVEAVKNGKRKTKKEIKSEGSNLNVFLIRAWKCFSLRKSLQTCIKLHSFFFVCFYPLVLFSLLCWETEKREGEPPAGLEEAALRAPSWRKSPLVSSVEESTYSCRSKWGRAHLTDAGKEGTGLVGESLTGFFPATGCAPHVSLLHAVHLSALLRLPTGFPGSWCWFRCRRY